jgi:hypothetical protein
LSADARKLRKSPWTWLHALLAAVLAAPAFLISMGSLAFPAGNTLRLYCRKKKEPLASEVRPAPAQAIPEPQP